MLTEVVTLLLSSAPISPDFEAQARAACSAAVGKRPSVEGIRIDREPGERGLSKLRVTDQKSTGWMYVYYDKVSERAALARAACFGAQLRLLSDFTGNVWQNAQWSSVVLTSDSKYIPPRDGTETRWTVPIKRDGGIDAAGQSRIVTTMPHEQVHAFQRRAGADLVRWFQEGHAEWVGRKVTAAIAPDEADANAREYADALNASKTPVRLAKWGGLAVKSEAILRQISAEDRRKMETDPTYVPAGPFSFKSDDFESDESNTKARYQASWALFRDLEQKQGGGAVRDWATSATSHAGAVSSSEVVASAPPPSRDEIENRLQ
ncbi:hypothetical protein CYFUS_003438 [Cystobacter fuscus]|uniref:Uncharacterized protein n=1 Tax=Cystobacter fuscus TaxID=43 RepID=A0A250J3C7_9BACT|nr:hypothetical protein [Cystobacter fuscus]ATB38012.1 hypothetical protein CYFUS_003438 [Cystobacter fuscus]